MPERRDYLPVCNDQGVPLVDFQAMFCIRCVQPECTRSQTGSRFETRVSTWEERLFKNPDRMSKDDPLYAVISAKRFIEIDVGRIPEVNGRSEWMDPRALEEPPAPAPAKPRPAKKPRETTEAVEAEPPPKPKVESPAPLQSRLVNSSFQQGLILPGARETTPQKPKDLWEPAPAVRGPLPKETAPIVRQGARLRFGGETSGVEAGKGEPNENSS